MRQIHPVSFHEKFVASGTYKSRSLGHIEHWSIHEQPDGAQLIRVDKSTSEQRGVLIEGWRSPSEQGSRIERIDIHLLGFEEHGSKRNASYVFEPDSVQISFSTANKPRQHKELPLPPNCIANARSNLFLGLMIGEAAIANGECIPVCDCTYPDITSLVFFDKEAAIKLGRDTVTIAGRLVNADSYLRADSCPTETNDILTDGEILPIYWLDEYNILLQMRMPNEDTASLCLTQYARRPDPPKS